MTLDLGALHRFAIAAKRATYVGGGGQAEPTRQGSHDLVFVDGAWSYRDSYFGGTDFIGQEVIWHEGDPLWAMNYHGYIIRDDLITPTQAGETLKTALSVPDAQARLLDNLTFEGAHGAFKITSQGTIRRFSGRETIHVKGQLAYALDYHGGLIRP